MAAQGRFTSILTDPSDSRHTVNGVFPLPEPDGYRTTDSCRVAVATSPPASAVRRTT